MAGPSRRRRRSAHPVHLGKWLVGAIAAAAVAVPVTSLLTGDSRPAVGSRPTPASLVHIRTSIEYQSGDHWIVPESSVDGDEVDHPPDASDCTPEQIRRKVDWFHALGAVPAGGYWLRLEVVNDSPYTLTIESIALASFERLSPLPGRSLVLCSEGSGDVGSQYISLGLAAHPPTFTFYDDTYQPTAPFTFAPARNAPVVTYVVMSAGGSPLEPPDPHRYRWTMRLRYSLGGHVYSRLIDDHGEPFDVTDAARSFSDSDSE